MPGLSDLLRNPRRLQQFASTPGNYPAALDAASRMDERAYAASQERQRASYLRDKAKQAKAEGKIIEGMTLETGDVMDRIQLPSGEVKPIDTPSGKLVKVPGKSNLFVDPDSGEPYQADPSKPGGLRSAYDAAKRVSRAGKQYAVIPGIGEKEIGIDEKAVAKQAEADQKAQYDLKAEEYYRQSRPFRFRPGTHEPIPRHTDEQWAAIQKQKADEALAEAHVKKLKSQAARLDLEADEIKLTAPKIAKEDEDAYSAAEAALAEFAKGESLDTAAERLAAQPDTGDEATAQAKAAAQSYMMVRDKVKPAKEAEAKIRELNLRALDLKKQMLDPEAWKAEKAAALPAMDDASLAAEAKAQAEIITEQEADANDTITKIQEGRQKIADELDAFLTLRQQKEAFGITAEEMQALNDQQAQMEATLADYDDWHAEAAGEAQASLKAAGDRREVLAAAAQEGERRNKAAETANAQAKAKTETMGKARDLYAWAKDNFHYTDDYRGMEDYGILDAEAKKRGIDPAQAREALQYFRQLDWSNEHRDPGTGKPLDETARLLPDGNVTVNPALLLDPKAYNAAVDATETTAEAKKRAKLMRADLAEPVAAEAIKNLRKNSDFADWLDKNTSGTDLERMEKFNAEMKAGGALNASLMKFFGSAASLPSGWLGAVAGLTGSDKALEYARYWQDRAQAYQTAAGEAGKGTNMAGRFMASVAGGVPSVMESMAVGGVAGRVLGSGAAALGTAAVDAAAQSGGGTFVEAVDAYMKQGLPEEEAKAKAAAPALASGLVTGVLTALGGGGVESLLRQDGQELAKAAIKRGLKSMIGREVAEGATEESFEEWSDQMLQGIIAQLSYDPNKSLEQVFTEATEAGLVGGVLGGGASGIRAFANRNAPTEGSQPYTPEGPAPAQEAGRAPAMPTQPRAAGQKDVGKIIEAFTPSGVPMPQAVNDTIKRTGRAPDQVAKAAASGLVKVAQGASLESLDAREREALGFISKDGKIVPAPKTTPLVEIYKDKLVIRNEAAEWLEEEDQSFLARQIKLDEAARKAQIDEAAAKPASKRPAEVEEWDWTEKNKVRRKVTDEWFEGGMANAEVNAAFERALQYGGENLATHGMAKFGTLSQAYDSLMSILTRGIDPKKGRGKLDVAPLVVPRESAAAMAGTTAGGTSYRDGPFILVSRKQAAIADSADVHAILVNDANAGQIDAIRKAIHGVRPDIIVELYSKADEVARQLNQPAKKKAGQAAPKAAESTPQAGLPAKSAGSLPAEKGSTPLPATTQPTPANEQGPPAPAPQAAPEPKPAAGGGLTPAQAAKATPEQKARAAKKGRAKATVPAAEVGQAKPVMQTVAPETDELLGKNERGESVYWNAKTRTLYSISSGKVKTAPWIEGLPKAALDRIDTLASQAPAAEVQPPTVPTAVDEAAQEAAASPAAETKVVEDMTPEERRADEKAIQRKLLQASLESDDKNAAFAVAGYTQVDGFWVHPHVDPEFIKALKPETKKRLKEGGVTFFDPETESSARAISFNDGTRGIGIKTDRKIGASAFTLKDIAVLHELGHHIWQNELTTDQKINFASGGIRTEHGREVASGAGRGETYKGRDGIYTDGMVAEEDFAQHFAENNGDLAATLAPARQEQSSPPPASQETASQPEAQPATPLARAQAALAAYQAKAVEARKQAQAAGDDAAETLAVKKYGLERILRKRLEAMSGVIDIDLIDPQNVDDVLLIEPKGPTGGILRVNIEGLLDRMAKLPPAKGKQALDTYIFHEFIHRAAIAKMSSSKIERLYNAITPEAKEASRKLYFLGAKNPNQRFNDNFQAAHEWFAQVVEARLRGKVSNQEELEASSDPTLLQQLAALFRDFVAQLRDIAGLVKDKAMAEQIRAEADAVQAAAEAMAAKAGLAVGKQEAEAAPETPADPNIGREWDSVYGRQRIVSRDDRGLGSYLAQTVGTDTVRHYSIQTIDDEIRRQEYALTPEYAAEQEERKARAERQAQAEKAQEEAKAKAAEQVNAYFDDIGLNPMQRGKLKAALDQFAARRSSGTGKEYSGPRYTVTEQMVADGFQPQTEQVPAMKELSGTQWNRMDNRQQQEFERKRKAAGMKTEYRLALPDGSMFEVTKAEHDYAKWLAAKAGLQVKAEEAGQAVSSQPADLVRQHLDADDAASALAVFTGMTKDEINNTARAVFGRGFYNNTKAEMLEALGQWLPQSTKSVMASLAKQRAIANAERALKDAKEKQARHAEGLTGMPGTEQALKSVSEAEGRDPHGIGKEAVAKAWQKEVDDAQAKLDALKGITAPAEPNQPAAEQADPTLWADVSRFFASMNSDSSRSAAIKDLKNGTATEDSNGYLIDLLENPNWTGNARTIAPKLIARLKATMGQPAAQAQPEPSPAPAVPTAGEAEAPALPPAEPYASPLAQFVGEWLGMNASQQSRVDMPHRVIRLAVNQADTEAVMALVQEAGTKGADGQLLFNTPHQRLYNELREMLRFMQRKNTGTEKGKVSTQLTAVPTADEAPALPPAQAAAVAKEEAMPEPAKQAAPFDAAAAKGQKKFLLAEVAAAVKAAPRRAEMTQEQKDTINLLESLPNELERASSKAEAESVRLRFAATKADAKRLIGYVTIEVPGDGTFTILNEKGALAQFQKRADKFPVSAIRDDLPAKPTAQAPTAVPALKKPKTTADVVAAIYPMVSEDTTRGAAINNVTGDGTHLFATDGRVLVRVEQENGGGKGREIALYDEKGVAKPLPDDERPYDGNQVIPDDKDFTPYTLDTGRWFSLMSQARAVLKTLPGEEDSIYKSVQLYRNPDSSLGVFASDPTRGDYAHNIQPEAKFLASYNPEYMQTILRVVRNLGQEQVEMRIQDDVSPATLRAPNAVFVIMPMRVSGAAAYSPEAMKAKGQPPVTEPAPSPAPAAEPGQGQAEAGPEAGKITDFGEKIFGARKDVWGKFKRIMDQAFPESYEDVTLSRNVPEPDYEAAIEAGVSVDDLALLKAIRDNLPPKPKKSWKLKSWGDAVKFLHQLTQDVIEGKGIDPAVLTGLERTQRLSGLSNAIKLYKHLGYPLFTKAKGWTVANWDVGYYKGQKLDKFMPATIATKDERSTDMLVLRTGEEAWREVAEMIKTTLAGQPSEAPKAKEAKKLPFAVWQDRRTGQYFVGIRGINGVVRLKSGFPDVKAARQHLADNRADLEAMWQGMKEHPEYRRTVNEPRQGPARRDGDVSPQMFQDAFGFRGVQFGNWVESDRRQTDLNQAYDALMDLAEALGVPPKAMSLDGSLGLAFGARGVSKYKAHYEPGEVVINLTKKTGPGSLAHEWFHAFDNYFARLDDTGATKARPLDKYATTQKPAAAPKNMRPEVWQAFRQIASTLKTGPFAERSATLDDARSKPYYSTLVEKSARAFEKYIADRLLGKDITNDYLVNIVKDESPALPTSAEMADGIRAAYDSLFNILDSVPTETGVMLRTPPGPATPTPLPADEGQAGPGLAMPPAGQAVTPGQDAEYLAAVRAGDLAKAQSLVDEAAEAAGIYKGAAERLKKWAQENTDEETRRATFIEPSGETRTFANVISDMAFITDESAVEYVRWLQALPNLSETARDIVADMAYVAKIPATVLNSNRGNIIPLSQRFNPASPSTLYAPPGDQSADLEAAARAAMGEAEAGQPATEAEDLAETARLMDEQQKQAEAEAKAREELRNDPANIAAVEASGAMAGRNLSKQFTDPAARSFYQALTAAREMLGGPETVVFEEVRKWAARQLESDPAGAIAYATELADNKTIPGVEGQAVLAAVIEALNREVAMTGDKNQRLLLTRLGNYYLDLGTALAQGLGFRRDTVETPQDRWNKALRVVFGPAEKVRRRLRLAPTEAGKARRIAELEAQLARYQGSRRADIEAALAEAKRQETQESILEKEDAKNEKLKDQILGRMDLTERDLTLSPVDRYSLQTAILDLPQVREALDNYPDGRDIMRQAMRGFSDEHIAGSLGLNQDDVAKFIKDATNAIIRPAVKAEVQAGRGFGDMVKSGLQALARKVGLRMAAVSGPLGTMSPPLSAADLAKIEQEVDDILNFALQPASRRNKAGRLISKVIDTPGGKKVRVFVPFDPDDAASFYAFAREFSTAKSGFFDKLYEYWINWPLLGGPQTQVANITGNAAQLAWHYTGQRLAEAALNVAYRDPNSAQLSEFKHIATAFFRSMGPALDMARQSFLTEGDTVRHKYLNEPMEIEFKDGNLDKLGAYRPAIGGKAGRLARLPGRLLRFADAFFKTAILHTEAAALAYRKAHAKAKAQGLTGANRATFIDTEMANDMNNQGSDVWVKAMDTAEELLFQDENAATDLVDAMLGGHRSVRDLEKLKAEAEAKGDYEATAKLSNRIFWRSVWGKIMRLIFPFQRTPTNIIKAGLRKAGGAALAGAWHATRAGLIRYKDGKPFVESYTKAMQIKDLSESLLAGLGWLALSSMFEGDDDDEKKPILIVGGRSFSPGNAGEREAFLRQTGGANAFLFRDKDGKTIGTLNYGRFEPVGTLLSAWVDGYRNFREVNRRRSQGEPDASYLTYIGSSLFASIEGKSFLQGVSGVMDTIRSFEERREPSTANWAAKQLINAAIPNIIKQPLRNWDDLVRETKTAGTGYTALPNPEVAPKMPFFQAQPKVTTTGEQIKKGYTGPARLLFQANTVVTPQPDALLFKVNRLRPTTAWFPQPLQKDDFYVRAPGSKPGTPGYKTPVTDPAKQRQLSELIGRKYAEKARRIAASLPPSAKNNPPAALQELHKKAMAEARAEGRAEGGIRGLHKTATPAITTSNK